MNRLQIVQNALSLAGRSSEIQDAAKTWLNLSLRDIGLTFRFPELRKTGTTQSLGMGLSVAALPTDLGSGMEKSGMIFGPNNTPMDEVSFQEFANNNGFPISGTTGRPYNYLVDKESGYFKFDKAADQAYSFTPTYFKTPPILSTSPTYDQTSVWIDNDALAVQALIWWIYIFTEDAREDKQEARVQRMLLKWERDVTKTGGTSRVMPSPARFKTGYRGIGGFGF